MKLCKRCGQMKSLDQFSPDTRKIGRRLASCKSCRRLAVTSWRKRNPEYNRTKKAQYRAEGRYRAYYQYRSVIDKPRKWRSHLEKKYNITPERWAEKLVEQSGLCAICGAQLTGPREPCTDHCHETGVVRGLLCNDCNAAIGLLKDDPDRIRKAASYISHHRKGGLHLVG